MPSKIMEWLLEEADSEVRYAALTKLIGYPPESEKASAARAKLMGSGLVAEILSKQEQEGYWGNPNRFYNDKYTGSCWNLLLLAEFGADPKDSRVMKACEFILNSSQDPEGGGFSYARSTKTGHGLQSGVIPCLTGNMVYSFVKLGRFDDPRVKMAIDWIVNYQRTDDGFHVIPKGTFYDRYEMCWGKHSCHMGVAKALKALSAIPSARRTLEVMHKIDELAEYFLKHRIFKRSSAPEQVSKPGWLRFGFPLMYQTDALELLSIFADLDISDERLADAISLVRHKMKQDGKWLLENSFNGKMLVNVEKKGLPSKWVTMRAFDTLRIYNK